MKIKEEKEGEKGEKVPNYLTQFANIIATLALRIKIRHIHVSFTSYQQHLDDRSELIG